MRIVHWQDDPQRSVEAARAVLAAGQVLIYPTDTSYALGVDALNPEAVARVFALKARTPVKALSVCVGCFTQISNYARLDPLANALAQRLLPGPLTLLLPRIDPRLEAASGGSELLGIRIPDHPLVARITGAFGHPITATSANISGGGDSFRDSEAESFARTLNTGGLCLLGGAAKYPRPSTVLEVWDSRLTIRRQGAIDRKELEKTLRAIKTAKIPGLCDTTSID